MKFDVYFDILRSFRQGRFYMLNIRTLTRRLACILLLVSLFSGYDVGVFRPVPKAQALDNSLLARWTFDVVGGASPRTRV